MGKKEGNRGRRGCEKVSGVERFPAHFAHKELQKAAQVPDKITHRMKIESGWDPSPAFVHTGKAIRAGYEETAWARRFNASCLTNIGAPCQAGCNCATE